MFSFIINVTILDPITLPPGTKNTLYYGQAECTTLQILLQFTLCLCLYVCGATPPRRLASRVPNFPGLRYEPTIGSSPFYLFLKFTALITFLRIIELPFVIIMYNGPQELLTIFCVFSSIIQSYVIQRQGVATRY